MEKRTTAATGMCTIRRVTAGKALHMPGLGGRATTRMVTDAACEALRGDNL